MDHSIYYEHSEDHPLQSIDLSHADSLPQEWLFLAYSHRRDYAFYGIFTDYQKAKKYMENKEGYFGNWTSANTYERIIMFDPNHPVLYWGYGNVEPTYLVVWEFCSARNTVTELLPGYDWSQYKQRDNNGLGMFVYNHTYGEFEDIQDVEDTEAFDEYIKRNYIDGIGEDYYSHHILVGVDRVDAINRAKGVVFKEELAHVPKLSMYEQSESGVYEVPYIW